eukprot:gi/632970868/ref/XP_007901885.1/ PREDICTED: uncharacterized protein LOC103185279 isoform X1 [Callorhinchus milii]
MLGRRRTGGRTALWRWLRRAAMARNAEKQLGRLNRLWLHREREEGRLREPHQNRPRLTSLNTAAEVKRWIPSIKAEIEYYLQQSQLSHYSERKIKEFQDHIEGLRKEYQSYLWKVRHLDPSNKEHPWKPRAYTRKRPDKERKQPASQLDESGAVKRLRTPLLSDNTEDRSLQDHSGEDEEESGRRWRSPVIQDTGILYDCSTVSPELQDQPLTFDKASLRFSMSLVSNSTQGEHSHQMSTILRSQLPNLRRILPPCGTATGLNSREQEPHTSKAGKSPPETALQTKSSEILGLSCYYSSDDDT